MNWAAPAQRVLMSKASIGEIGRGRLGFTAELRGLAHRFDQAEGRTYQRMCDADLGDARCRASVSSSAATVTGADGDRTIGCTGLSAFASGHFRHGRMVWTGGANAGLAGEVKVHRGGGIARIELWERAPRPVLAGDTFDVWPGCDKSFDTCRSKFSNGDNFRGFPHMPGNDRAFAYVTGESGEHDGGSFFN